MNQPPILRGPAAGRTIGVVGDLYRFLATGSETGGKYAMWEAVVPPGGGPPPHRHTREEEAFYVLEGTMSFEVDGQTMEAPAGTFANLPIGSLHRFYNASERTARMLITVAPAGLEEMFFEVGVPLAAGEQPSPPTHDEIARLLAAAPRYGVEIQVPPPK